MANKVVSNILARLSKLELTESERGRELLFILPPEAQPHGEDWGGCYRVTYSSERPDALMTQEQVEALAETENSTIFYVVAAPRPDYTPPVPKAWNEPEGLPEREPVSTCNPVEDDRVDMPQRNGIWPKGR